MDLAAALEMPLTGRRPRLDVAAGTLVGSRCADCGASAWPARAVCHRCGGAAMRQHVLSRTGILVSCTRVMVPRPGLPTPYLLGRVHLDDGPVVFGAVSGIDGPGDPLFSLPWAVTVRVDGARYWFEPERGHGHQRAGSVPEGDQGHDTNGKPAME